MGREERHLIPELLSPAGGPDQLEAAIRFGADAVYLGGKAYGLRAFAGNFDRGQLSRAADRLHAAGKRLYVTMNIFCYDRDIPGIAGQARFLQSIGADAAIVSDAGLVQIVKDAAPELPLHLSTQANVLNTPSALFWHGQGIRRIVLARELSLAQIVEMRRSLPEDLELEAFCHGAMCASYSGRCVLSNHMAARDGNQGKCAQVCRWRFSLVEEKRPGEYMPIFQDEEGTTLYSANDLCMIEHVGDMARAGVGALKIEGRMKTDHYVATVTQAYRRAIDLFAAGRPFDPRLLEDVRCASHRLSGTGFYYGQPDSPPGPVAHLHGAVYLAAVLDVDENGLASVRQKNKFSLGDAVEALTPGGALPFTVASLADEAGLAVPSAPHPGQILRLPVPDGVRAGDFLRKRL